MNPKIPAVLGYFTILFWLIALLIHRANPNYLSNHHLKNALFLHLASLLFGFLFGRAGGLLGLGSILFFAILVYAIMGIIYAIGGKVKPLPLIGDWIQNNLPNL